MNIVININIIIIIIVNFSKLDFVFFKGATRSHVGVQDGGDFYGRCLNDDDEDNVDVDDKDDDDDVDTQVAQWSQCSKTCGSGQQGRVIQCIGETFSNNHLFSRPVPHISFSDLMSPNMTVVGDSLCQGKRRPPPVKKYLRS